jgi:glycosyltransferase involved in cell wall biosynthesis
MRVALYYPWIYLTSGVERTLVELSGRSRHQWTLYTSHFEPEHTFPEMARRSVVTVGEVSVVRSIGAVATAAAQILRLRLPLENHDMLVVASEGLGDLAVFRNAERPTLCLCFTPLRAVFDPAYRRRALEEQDLAGRMLFQLCSWLFCCLDRLAWRKYGRVVCISHEARRRALAGRLVDDSKITVLYPAAGVRADTPSDRFDHYFLAPGRIMWTKNLELGIAAFRRFKASSAEFQDYRLVIAGIVDKKSEAYYARLRELAAPEPGIDLRLHPSDSELAELYRNCRGVLFTAFNEDWGIVPLESMTFGKPVISVNRGGPRESIQHGVQGFLEEPEAEAFAVRMAELARDSELSRRMGIAGFQYARRYSWQSFADHMDEELDRLAARSEVRDG